MDVALNYMANKFEHAVLALGEKTNVKSVEAKTQQNQKAKSGKFNCNYCKGDHRASDCTKYETLNARRDRVIAQRLCFSCLRVGHSSKNCKSTKTCCICNLHHHTSLCNQQTNLLTVVVNLTILLPVQKGKPLMHVVVVVVIHNPTPICHNNNNNNRNQQQLRGNLTLHPKPKVPPLNL